MTRKARTITVAIFATFCAVGVCLAEGELVWSDEFDGTALNTSNWEIMIGDGSAYGISGWGNNEWQYYTSREENLYVADGYLHIVARQESYEGFSYTSARIRSENRADFRYGRMEGRLKLPSTTGIWPAFWMMPTDSPYGGWAAAGEIDIMECINTATTVYGTLHFGGTWPNNTSSGGAYSPGVNFGDDFHVYALEWEPDIMRWYVDGVLYHTETSDHWYSDAAPENDRAPFDQWFHFLLNVAVGGNWPGYPDGTSVFPQEMVVDYVRVYSFETAQSPYLGHPHYLPSRVEAEDFDIGGEGTAYHDCDGGNSGGAYRTDESVDIEACDEGGYNIGWLCDGEWIEYTLGMPRATTYVVECRVASESTGGEFHLEFGDTDPTGTLTVPVTGGWQDFESVMAGVALPAGTQIMRFVNDSNTDEYNVNYFEFFYAADLDHDGTIGLADLQYLLSNYGLSSAEVTDGDLDLDGDVDLADLQILLSLYGVG